MRLLRYFLIFTAFYLVFIGGSAYYNLIVSVRLFHQAFITILLIIWLLNRLRLRRGLPHTPLNWPLYAAVGVWLLTSLTSLDIRMALENLWFPLTHLIIFFILVDLFQQRRGKQVIEAQFIVAALIVVVTGMELASWYFGLGIVPGTSIGWTDVGILIPYEMRRVSLAMNISTLLAGYVAPLVTITAVWALTTRPRGSKVVLWILAVLLMLVLILTFSRGGLLSLGAALGVMAIFQVIRAPQLTRRISIPVIIGGASVVAALTLIVFIVFTITSERASGDAGRVDMWTSAIAMATDYPVTGVGPGLYGRAFRAYRDPVVSPDKLASAHNVYLNTLAETGLIGAAASLWLLAAFLITWRARWQTAETVSHRLRLEAVLAALIGLGVHSLVDVFTITPIILLTAGLIAYGITGHRTTAEAPPPDHPVTAFVAVIMVAGFGLWFGLQINPAYLSYLDSLENGENAIERAQAATDIDPALTLYHLQIANLRGLRANDADSIASAITAYEHAVALEPTWDIGWSNLAALELRRGNTTDAIAYLDHAWAIQPRGTAPFHYARLTEADGDDSERVIAGYERTITISLSLGVLPQSPYWHETLLRQETVSNRLAGEDIDLQYRVQPDMVDVPAIETSTESGSSEVYWVFGENALDNGDATQAADYFTLAINRDRTRGDLYASRARATYQSDPLAAWQDLDLAELLGTRFEYPNTTRAYLVNDPDLAADLRTRALPPRTSGQEFAAVLFGGRLAAFDVLPEMRLPGPGTAVMQVWYELAQDYELRGEIERAAAVYRGIVAYAPYETRAQDWLAAYQE